MCYRTKTLQAVKISAVIAMTMYSSGFASAFESNEVCLEVKGMVNQVQSFTLKQLKNLPTIKRENKTQNLKNPSLSSYQGISVWEIIKKAGPLPKASAVIFFSKDGYSGGLALPLEYLKESDAILALTPADETATYHEGLTFVAPSHAELGYKWVNHGVARMVITNLDN